MSTLEIRFYAVIQTEAEFVIYAYKCECLGIPNTNSHLLLIQSRYISRQIINFVNMTP